MYMKDSAMFAGKSILVTGAASGIGRALCLEAASRGAHLFALDANSKALYVLTEELQKRGAEFETAVVNVTDYNAFKNTCEKLVGPEKIDYFVNNAGIAATGTFAHATVDLYKKIIDVNLLGVMHGTHIALAIMEKQGFGTIVNMASIAGYLPTPFLSIYSASKFGVVGFSKALQEELVQKNSPVRVAIVAPAFVRSDMTKSNDFPEWLSFMLATPSKTAADVLSALAKNKRDIYPGISGKLMLGMHKLAPKRTIKGSKILLTRSFKDYILKRYIQPD